MGIGEGYREIKCIKSAFDIVTASDRQMLQMVMLSSFSDT
jgi:hypothetical protein